MVVNVNLKILGANVIQGRKDPSKFYNTISFLDGTESTNFMTNDADLFARLKDLPQLTELACQLDIHFGKYTNVRLVDAKEIKAVK